MVPLVEKLILGFVLDEIMLFQNVTETKFSLASTISGVSNTRLYNLLLNKSFAFDWLINKDNKKNKIIFLMKKIFF